MKTFIKYLSVFAMLFLFPVLAFCQDGTGSFFDPAAFLGTLTALAASVAAVTEFLKSQLKTKGIISQLLSWIVAIALSGLGWWLQIGMYVGVEWFWIFIYGLAGGLISNGIFDTAIVTAIISIFKKKK